MVPTGNSTLLKRREQNVEQVPELKYEKILVVGTGFGAGFVYLSFVCKSVFLVQNSFKHRNPCRYPVCILFLSVPGFQFGPVTVSFEAFSGHKAMMYTLKVGFTIVNNLIQHRGLDRHFILQTVSRY